MSLSIPRDIPFDLLKNVFIPTAIFTTLGYFWGWGATAAYLNYFGVSASFIQKSIPELVLAGWLELFLIAVSLVLGIGSFQLSRYIYYKLKSYSRFSMRRIGIFIFLLTISLITGGAYITYAIISTFSISFPVLLFLLFIPLAFFWVSALLGYQIEHDSTSKRLPNFPKFKIIFPSFYLYLFVMILGSIIWMNRFSGLRGIELAVRDTSPNSSLVNTTIYAEKPLPLTGNFDQNTELYEYTNLQLIDANDDVVILLINNAPSSPSRNFQTYIVARDKIALIEFNP